MHKHISLVIYRMFGKILPDLKVHTFFWTLCLIAYINDPQLCSTLSVHLYSIFWARRFFLLYSTLVQSIYSIYEHLVCSKSIPIYEGVFRLQSTSRVLQEGIGQYFLNTLYIQPGPPKISQLFYYTFHSKSVFQGQ